MTTPDIDGPPTPDEESLAFEALVVSKVTADVAVLIKDTIGLMLAAFDAATRGGPMPKEAARSLARAIVLRLRRLIWPAMDPRLQRAAADARDLGVVRAVQRVPEELHGPASTTSWRADEPRPSVPAADAALRERIAQAARLAASLDLSKRGNVMAVVGRTRSGLAVVQGHARWVANQGINAGTAAVAKATGQNLVWVAERNACLHCLAHAGWVVEPGSPFPGVSFDPRAKRIPAVTWPPLHPNCRCQVRTYDGPAGPPDRNRSLLEPAARIAAEARRSVVYQWTDHASKVAAERAASLLLRMGSDLPSSVEERARRALRQRKSVRRPR